MVLTIAIKDFISSQDVLLINKDRCVLLMEIGIFTLLSKVAIVGRLIQLDCVHVAVLEGILLGKLMIFIHLGPSS